MTDLEQIAYDNGVVCGFMVARGIYKTIAIEMLSYNYSDDDASLTNNIRDFSITEISD